jgi:hypothetical protein
MEPNRFEAVRKSTTDAIRAAAEEAFQEIKKEDLFAFGLCTDDDVSSLYHVYATRNWVLERQDDYPEIGLIPVEWEQQSDEADFEAISETLGVYADAESGMADDQYEILTTARFNALVDAMHQCRQDGLFDPKTLLVVTSTGACDLLEHLSCEAAKLSNSREMSNAYCKMMGGG